MMSTASTNLELLASLVGKTIRYKHDTIPKWMYAQVLAVDCNDPRCLVLGYFDVFGQVASRRTVRFILPVGCGRINVHVLKEPVT